MLKSIVCLCIFALISANAFQFELNDKALAYLAEAKLADLPKSVQLSLTGNSGRAAPGGSSHWCCINEQPITTVTQTKIDHATHVVGYVECGFMGSMRCSHFVTSYRQEMYTFIQTFQVPNMAACSSHEVKCCSGYLLVAENCHTFTDLVANQELFQFLSGLGLLTMPNVGK
ncbi:unnamed protein product [Rotaria sp. Silwood2]|nr:unnamed protein product [Rotaria sp. Silwood2]CAF3210796.1 unnamed protein product [Rotaria sp. Silwood2]CAF4461901.1 unnamed protein product [Rotaria sp. Silwood2]CAF4589535.1 unnamed protein product [Rotaria sp. Silwood2]CAF4613814.1 unnamed protein product [Rotaria sp. Silwood2]